MNTPARVQTPSDAPGAPAAMHFESCPSVRVGVYQNVVVVRWSGSPDSFESIAVIERAFERAHSFSGRRIGVLAIIDANAELGLPNMAYRTALGRLGRAWKGRIAERAIVYGAADWRASLVRSLITHLDSLWGAAPKAGKRVFSSMESAASWLATCMPRTAPVPASAIINLAREVQAAEDEGSEWESERTSGVWARGTARHRSGEGER